MAQRRILVFDSGVGGLTVAREIERLLPDCAVDYAADTGFFPYGDKSDDALRDRLPRVAAALMDAARPEVFVIACNTASTLALPEVRAALDVPVVGTVPAIKPAAELSRTGVIGLLATPGTIRRAYTDQLIADFASGVEVVKHGSLALVRLAEARAAGKTISLDEVAAAQAPLFEGETGARIDTVVLACTHFPLLREELMRAAPRPIRYIDSGEAIARQTARILGLAEGVSSSARRAYITSAPETVPGTLEVLERFGYRDPARVVRIRKGTMTPDVA